MSLKAIRMGWAVVCGLLLAGFSAGCSCGKPWHSSGDPGQIETGIDVIRVGERIFVSITDLSAPPAPIEQRVREDGKVMLWFNEEFLAAGRRISEFQEEIRQRYLKTYFQRLTVSVRVEGRFINVGGYVRSPSRYDYQGQMTVLDAIKVAGDFNEFANRACVRITRSTGEEVIANCKKALTDPSYDPPLYPGDDVYVPKKAW
ncbi:MAG: polysaccharide biosynthesis/export family protein [Verrucomicrobiales bacterium]|nr:polysaccharide biosynthesis/export family protein [Verrucomicrobiales bacterium]